MEKHLDKIILSYLINPEKWINKVSSKVNDHLKLHSPISIKVGATTNKKRLFNQLIFEISQNTIIMKYLYYTVDRRYDEDMIQEFSKFFIKNI